MFQTEQFCEKITVSPSILEKKDKLKTNLTRILLKSPVCTMCVINISVHTKPLKLTYKCLPRPWIFTLSPAIGPPQNHSVVLHATKSTGLDQVSNSFSNFIGHNYLTKSFNLLNFHHVLNSL